MEFFFKAKLKKNQLILQYQIFNVSNSLTQVLDPSLGKHKRTVEIVKLTHSGNWKRKSHPHKLKTDMASVLASILGKSILGSYLCRAN